MSPVNDLCRLCHSPLRDTDSPRRLCAVCDEYTQHVALQSNRALERVVGDVQRGVVFQAATRRMH